MDRRANERHNVWFPMTVVCDGGEEGTAITFDVSSTGLLMACAGSLEVGQHVTLCFELSSDSKPRKIPGTIRRVDPREGAGPWHFRMAVEFDQPHFELEAQIKAEAAQD